MRRGGAVLKRLLGPRGEIGAALGLALLLAAPLVAQEQRAVEFRFDGQVASVPRHGSRVELLPVLRLIGAEAVYSPAAGTYGVGLGDREVQFALDRQTVLANGTLLELGEKPVPSPGGVAASVDFLDRAILAPLGFHLEAVAGGYRVATGGEVLEPVTVRPAAADFGSTTTLVLALGRATRVEVVAEPSARAVVRFDDAAPQLDPTVTLRSPRVRALLASGRELKVELPKGVGLLSWHALADPPRVILELGQARPVPTPAAQLPPEPVGERAAVAPIVIDPGHGGDDTGAVAAGAPMEKDLVLEIARRLRAALEARGHVVRLTREGDDSRALSDRTAVANRLGARAFVSLHANSSKVASVHGAETYYMSLGQKASDEAAAATASVENQPAGPPPERTELQLILWDLAQTDVLNESARLALSVQTRLNQLLGLADRGVKQAPFVVLTGATMPAVLVEVGFLSNPAERALLQDPDHQQRLAEAIALGVHEVLGGP